MLRVLPAILLLSLLIVSLPLSYGLPGARIFNPSSYINSNGEPVIAGEVINDGSEAIRSVEIKATFLGPSGSILGTNSASTAIDVIPPGQRAPFMIIGDSSYARNIDRFEIQVVSFNESDVKAAELELLNVSERSDGIRAVVSGEIRNNGDRTATMPKIYATFYGNQNNVINFVSGNVEPNAISPNQNGSFSLELREGVSAITSYTLYAESDQFSTIPYGLRTISISPIGQVTVSSLSLIDQQGKGLGKLQPNTQGWIRSEIRNNEPTEQDFVYIVQIKDNEGFPVELKWISGVVEPSTSIIQSVSWTPENEGLYFAQIFVWNSIENPVPLATSIRTIILLVES